MQIITGPRRGQPLKCGLAYVQTSRRVRSLCLSRARGGGSTADGPDYSRKKRIGNLTSGPPTRSRRVAYNDLDEMAL